MNTALRAGALIIITGAVAGLVLIFASDPVEAPIFDIKSTKNTMTFTLTSAAFNSGDAIPSRFTCDGENVNPPLVIDGVPEGTKSLTLLVDDPDVPKQLRPDGVFDHWTLFNIDPGVRMIATGEAPGTQGANGAGKSTYAGPCPPPQYEPSEHRYFFKLYALDTMLDVPAGATKSEVRAAMEGHLLAKTELIGKYKRVSQ